MTSVPTTLNPVASNSQSSYCNFFNSVSLSQKNIILESRAVNGRANVLYLRRVWKPL